MARDDDHRGDDKEDVPLTFYPLNEVCADGSPAGYYTDYFVRTSTQLTSANNNGNIDDNHQKHTVVFREGGACFSVESCQSRKNIPILFGTSELPGQISGTTILSSNATENPTGFSDNYRWIVPYCTQDLWLGDGSIDESGLFRSGSKIVHSFWDEWERTVTADAVQLVVVGISAGTMAVLNHFDRILQVAVASSSNTSSSSNSTNNSSTSATQLCIILDSPDFGEEVGSQAGQTIQTFADAHIDPNIHPLCHRNATNSSAFNTGAIDLDLISDLPCCASVHCLMRNEPTLSSWARGDMITGSISNDQVMLLLDSTFDTIAILSELSLPSSSPQNGARMPSSSGSTNMIYDFTTLAWDVGGIAGQSRTRLLETVQNVLRGAQQQQSPRIRWALSSAIGHPFLLDSFDLALARCGTAGSYTDASGISVVCNQRGPTFSTPFFRELEIAIKRTDETWKLSAVNGTSIQTLISSINNIKSANSNKEEEDEDIPNLEALFPIRNVAILDTCAGPNCVSFGSTQPNLAQSLITIEDAFVPLPIGLQVTLAVVFFSFPALAGLNKKSSNHNQANKNKNTDTVSARNDYVDAEEAAAVGPGEDEVQRQRKKDPGEGQSVFVKDLNVTTDSGQRILQDVSINLKGSTFTGLLGLSGSGKSTLMSVLAQQVPNDLGISADSISTLSDIPTTLLRQADVVDFEMMTPIDYLISTAEIYDTSKKDIDDVLQLVRPFFTVRKEKLAEGGQGVEEKVVLDPFTDNLVGRLSGGQRKMLAIAAALFNSPKLLLLDEPLSGLDSSSSERVCDLLRDIATHKAMTILMIIHQPSNDLLMKMDGVIVMCKGRVLLEKEVENIGTDFSPAEYVHTILENCNNFKCSTCHPSHPSVRTLDPRDLGSYLSDVNRMSMELIGSEEPKELELELELQEQNKITRPSPMKYRYVMPWKNIRLRQVQPLVKRMQLENGFGWKDLLVLPACFALITAWLRFESGSPIQVYLATTLFIIVPTITFQPRLIVICNNFRAHAFELEDKRVSSVAFLIASAIFAYGIPVVAIVLGHLIGYPILGWEWDTFLVQILFAIGYTTAAIQVGKTLSVAARGDYTKLTRGYVLFIFLSILFSGFFVNVNNVPDYLRWLFNGNFGENPCLSFVTCIAFDRNFLARYFGYTPTTTTLLSILVLLIWLVAFFLLEGFLLLRFSSASPKLNISKKDAKIE
eukprot:scaffold7470_cov84-Skeletonema_dohrnii-CCMP3373.AAC.3